MRIQLDRALFVVFLIATCLALGINTWGTLANRHEAALLREDRLALEELRDKVEETRLTAERADNHVRAVRDFSVCSFVLVLGLPLPQDEAEKVIEQCVEAAEFPLTSEQDAEPASVDAERSTRDEP